MVTFENGRRAVVVETGAAGDPGEVLTQLGLHPGRPVIVVVGGADTLTDDAHRLAKRIVAPALARASTVTGAAIVDGGTDSGIMAIVGEAFPERGDENVLLGVAPARRVALPGSLSGENEGRAALEPNHTHFALADS